MNCRQRDEFHKSYVEGDHLKIKTIIKEHFPSTLIKFFSGFGNGVYPQCENVDNGMLWLSSPHYFNDPFDCVLNVDYQNHLRTKAYVVMQPIFGSYNAQTILNSAYFRANLANKAIEMRTLLQKHDGLITDNVFVSCFSEVDNLTSLRMWGHYANCHKGFCAQYDFIEINRAFPSGVIPVRYNDDYKLHDNPLTDEECRAYRLQVAFTKAEEWKYEKEWRIMEINEEKEGQKGFNIQSAKPTKIFMGCRIDYELAKELHKVCEMKGIELIQMKMKAESFHLTYSEI